MRFSPVRVSVAALILAGAASTVRAQVLPAPSSAPPVPTIAVSGTGEATVVPDRARLSIGVQTQAGTAAEASQRNATLQQAVIAAIRGRGVPADQITTSGYNVFPEQTYDQATRRTRITGYNVQNTVTVELRDVTQVGPVLDAVLARGANLVSSLELYSSQAEAVRRRALANAVERARADAEAMAAAAGGRLGPLVELTSEISGPPRPMYRMAATRMAAAQAEADTPVSGGTQTVNATVQARYQFVAGR